MKINNAALNVICLKLDDLIKVINDLNLVVSWSSYVRLTNELSRIKREAEICNSRGIDFCHEVLFCYLHPKSGEFDLLHKAYCENPQITEIVDNINILAEEYNSKLTRT
jgi:hypothetical protein